MRQIIFVFLLTICSIAFTEVNSYQSIAAFTSAQTSPENKARVIISTEDDLNEDGIRDWVGILAYSSPIQNLQIFVLYGQKNGSYTISGKSKIFEYGGYAIGDGEIVEINKRTKNSFAVRFSAGGSTFRYIFKLQDKAWGLIGEDYASYNHPEGTVKQSTSINYITGKFTSTKLISGKNISISGNRKYPIFEMYEFDYYNPYGMEEFWK